jgi:hypothetical protein
MWLHAKSKLRSNFTNFSSKEKSISAGWRREKSASDVRKIKSLRRKGIPWKKVFYPELLLRSATKRIFVLNEPKIPSPNFFISDVDDKAMFDPLKLGSQISNCLPIIGSRGRPEVDTRHDIGFCRGPENNFIIREASTLSKEGRTRSLSYHYRKLSRSSSSWILLPPSFLVGFSAQDNIMLAMRLINVSENK